MPRTCQWPSSPDDMAAFIAGVTFDPCGTRTPSFQARKESNADPIDICDVHKPAAEAEGWEVGPYLTSRTRAKLDAQEIVDRALANVGTLDDPGPEEPDEDPVRLSIDPRTELDAMANIVEILDDFGEDAQRRIVTWAADFYGVPL